MTSVARQRSYERVRLSWEAVKNGEQLTSLADVVVIDRAKYAGNVGSILRHMPILGGAQILFLANSAHQPSSPYPPYPRSFIKEVMRVSMLQHYREFDGKFCLLDGGRDAVFQLLAILKSKGFVLMILENVEAFQEMSEAGRQAFGYSSIYDKTSALRDLGSPIAYIFGGESGPPLAELFQLCDVGGFIPSSSHSEPDSSDYCELEDEAVSWHRMHSCNLSIAACIVLGERHRLLLAKALKPQDTSKPPQERTRPTIGCFRLLVISMGSRLAQYCGNTNDNLLIEST
ncbi:ift43 [Symbiodinium sp. CCMP2456]|nr:ift43 [Symbiodinium sp. CCMP2456]